jgi:hypothetical protein
LRYIAKNISKHNADLADLMDFFGRILKEMFCRDGFLSGRRKRGFIIARRGVITTVITILPGVLMIEPVPQPEQTIIF